LFVYIFLVGVFRWGGSGCVCIILVLPCFFWGVLYGVVVWTLLIS